MLYSISRSIIALLLVAFSATAVAATTVPYTFTAGTAAKASEVNANFQALATAIDALSARVSKLDGTSSITASDLAGTYSLETFGISLSVDVNGGGLTGISVHNSTVTLVADGTGTMTTGSEQGSLLASPQSSNSPALLTSLSGSTPAQSFTWSLSGSSITISGLLGGPYSIISGGRLLVSSIADTPNGRIILILLSRIN